MIKFLSLTLSLVVLASCAGTANMKISEPLTTNEGIVVTNCKTPHSIARYINIFPEDHVQKFGVMPPGVKCTQNGTLAVIKLEAGKYHAGFTQNFNHYKHLPTFTVQPNKINYIGDLRFAANETNVVIGLLVGFKQPKVRVSALDKRQETMQRLRDERPDIADKYQVVYSIVGGK